MKVSTKIRTLRSLKNMKQEDLALKSNMSQHYLSEIENDLKSPRIEEIEAIVTALGITFENFMGFDDKLIFNNTNNNVEQQGHIVNEVNNEILTKLIDILVKQERLIEVNTKIFEKMLKDKG